MPINVYFRFIGTTCQQSVYGPYDPFLASSLAQVQQAVAAGGHHTIAGVTDPRIQVILKLCLFIDSKKPYTIFILRQLQVVD